MTAYAQKPVQRIRPNGQFLQATLRNIESGFCSFVVPSLLEQVTNVNACCCRQPQSRGKRNVEAAQGPAYRYSTIWIRAAKTSNSSCLPGLACSFLLMTWLLVVLLGSQGNHAADMSSNNVEGGPDPGLQSRGDDDDDAVMALLSSKPKR